jgi:hypothetical protein
MPAILYPNSGALWLAGVVKTALINSVLHLFQSGDVTLTPLTTLDELEDAECDYTGYVEQTIAAWLSPLLNPLGGASIESGLKQFSIAAPYTVTNMAGGWWIQDSTAALVCAGEFPTPRPLAGAGDGVPFNVELVFG